MAKQIHIGLAGNIGCGKSTVAEFFNREPAKSRFLSLLQMPFSEKNLTVFEERVLDNPYLKFYYKDQNRWAFESQIRFLALRYSLQQELRKIPGIVIEDRTFREDAIFARVALRNRGMYEGMDIGRLGFDTYKIMFDFFENALKAPHLIVYLKADPMTCLYRIKKRGRDYEQSMPLEYLEALHKEYERFFSEYEGNLLVIDANKDIYSNEDYLAEIAEQVIAKINSLERIKGEEKQEKLRLIEKNVQSTN